MLLTPAQIKPKLFQTELLFFSFFFFFFTRDGCVSRLRACLGARLLLQFDQYLNLLEGADRAEKNSAPFSGVTKNNKTTTKCEPVWPSGKALGW